MSEIGNVWLGHALLSAGCAVGSFPLILLLRGVGRNAERLRWASRTSLLAHAMLLASMGSFRIHNSDISHLEAADMLFSAILVTGLLVGVAARSKWSYLGVVGFGFACLLSFPTSMYVTQHFIRFMDTDQGPGSLAQFPAAWILGFSFPLYGCLAGFGALLALKDWLKGRPAAARSSS